MYHPVQRLPLVVSAGGMYTRYLPPRYTYPEDTYSFEYTYPLGIPTRFEYLPPGYLLTAYTYPLKGAGTRDYLTSRRDLDLGPERV